MTALVTDNLPLLAGAPNGIKKLRELILELAVRGKLVPQDPKDEPASNLLQRIAKEKAMLVAEGEFKKQKPLTAITDKEQLFELPASWVWGRLGELTLKITDGTHHSPTNTPSGDYKYISAKNIKSWGIDLAQVTYVTHEIHQEIFSRCNPSKGDILYIKDGATTGIATINSLDEPFSMLSSVALLKPSCGLHNNYMLKAMVSPIFYREMRAGMTGVAITRVTLAKLHNAVIPLPPLAEQHRIVAKVDELMALCDRLEAQQADAEIAHAQLVQALLDSLTQTSDATDFTTNWQRLAEHFHTLFTTEPSIDALKQTLLQLAVMGKLVPQDPSDEPASEYVKLIQTERQRFLAQSKARKQKDLVAASRPMPPFDAPKEWSWQVIDDLLHVTGGITLGRKLGDRKLVSLPYLRVANVQRAHLQLGQIKEIEVPEDEVEKYLLQDGDLLITEGGDWDKVGRTAVWRSELPECLHQNHVFRARAVTPEWEPRWAEMYLNSASAREYFAGSSKQTTNLASINMTQLRACAFPVPPLAEQNRIVAKVDQLMTLCDQLKARVGQARQLHTDLADALIAKSLNETTPPSKPSVSPREARALLGAEILYALDGEHHSGRVKLQKIISLTEHAAKLQEIQSNEQRFAAGPHDPALMRELASELEAQHWFAERRMENGKRYEYQPLSNVGEHRRAYQKLWSDEQRQRVDAVLNLVRRWDTARCERVSTLYSAWNDLLIEGSPCSEENILREVTHSWHDSKLQYSESEWRSELQSMKQHPVLIPSGFGRRTTGGTLTLSGFE